MTVARLLTVMAIVFIGLFAFQNCGQSQKAMNLVAGTSISSTTGALDGTYSVTTWTCNQKDILQALNYAGATAVQVALKGTAATQTVSFGNSCSSTEVLPIVYNSVSSVTLTQAAVKCGSGCTSTQCKAVAAPASPASMTLSYIKSVDSKTVTLSRTLASYDVTNTGWPYGGSGCGVGNSVTLILSK